MKRTVAALLVLLALPTTAGAAIPTGNLVANPGFEQGPGGATVPSWTPLTTPQRSRVLRFPASSTTFYTADQATAASAGCRGYVGPAAPAEGDDGEAGASTYRVFQDVTLPAEAPGKVVRFGALLGRYGNGMSESTDYAALEIVFLDAAMNTIGTGAASVDNYSPTASSTQEFTRLQATTTVPAGAASMRIFSTSVAIFGMLGAHSGAANGLVDDVKVTFDAALPTDDPTAGCRSGVPTTGDASELTTQSARLSGTVDTKHEDVRYAFQYGKGTALDLVTREADLGAADAPAAVTQALTNLEPSTSYSYRLVTRTVLDGTAGAETAGATQTFTTPPAAAVILLPVATPTPTPTAKRNDAKKAIAFGKPRKGCVKAGRSITVAVADKAEGKRKLTSFSVKAKVGRKTKTTKGPTGATTGSVKVERFPKRKGSKRILLTASAAFGPIDTVPASTDSVKRSRRFSFCRKPKRKR